MGQCLEHYGAGEPYQPLLEALTRLCLQPGRVEWIDAPAAGTPPSWLEQARPWRRSSRVASLRTATGTTPARMLRQLNDAIEAVTQRAPLLLWLERSALERNPSTLDWLAAFAQRPEPARVLFVGSRSAHRRWPGSENHPLGELADRLRVKTLCRDIALAGLDEDAVVEDVRTTEQSRARPVQRTRSNALRGSCINARAATPCSLSTC